MADIDLQQIIKIQQFIKKKIKFKLNLQKEIDVNLDIISQINKRIVDSYEKSILTNNEYKRNMSLLQEYYKSLCTYPINLTNYI